MEGRPRRCRDQRADWQVALVASKSADPFLHPPSPRAARPGRSLRGPTTAQAIDVRETVGAGLVLGIFYVSQSSLPPWEQAICDPISFSRHRPRKRASSPADLPTEATTDCARSL